MIQRQLSDGTLVSYDEPQPPVPARLFTVVSNHQGAVKLYGTFDTRAAAEAVATEFDREANLDSRYRVTVSVCEILSTDELWGWSAKS
jgi:hypothetical protein